MSSVVYSADRVGTILESFRVINLAMSFFTCFVLTKRLESTFLRRLTAAALVAATAPVLTACYQFASNTGLTIDTFTNRVYGTFAHPNVLATFCLVMLALIARERERDATSRKRAYLFFSLLLVLMIIATYTRAAWIVLVFSSVSIAFLRRRRRLLHAMIGGMIAVLLLGMASRFLPPCFQAEVMDLSVVRRVSQRPPRADSLQWRWWVVRGSFKIFAMRPILGFGYGTFPTVWDRYKDPARRADPSSEAHNDYIRLLVEEGVVGLGIYLIILISFSLFALKQSIRTGWRHSVFPISVLSYCLISLTENMLRHTASAWWLWALWGAWSAEGQVNPGAVSSLCEEAIDSDPAKH